MKLTNRINPDLIPHYVGVLIGAVVGVLVGGFITDKAEESQIDISMETANEHSAELSE